MKLFRNNIFIIATFATYYITYRIVHNHYYSILTANIALLAFLQVCDFREFLKVEELKKMFNNSCDTELNLVLPAEASSKINTDKTIRLISKPKYYLEYNSFYAAFKLKYIIEDTNGFITKFAGNLKMSFFSSFAIFLLAAIIFNNMPAAAADPSHAEADMLANLGKILLSLASTLVQLAILLRPYFVYYERNHSLAKG